MKASLVVVLLATAAAAGCAEGGGANPNLAAPKLVLQARADDSLAIFIHSAFGERLYEWISLSIDNETISNRTNAFSLEETVNSTSFYLEARAGTPREMYTLRARLDVDLADDDVRASFHRDDGSWAVPETFGLPFERVLIRRAAE
ncbi:MAG TPA: hypothetical protein VFH78_14715 [Candidatus Thermoplasmatota archaeon]|nr:hypothetical protein [Candidatus Thermoplasmatota archaeon]